MKRIGAGGIAIESCTFSPLPSTLDDFRVLRGDELIERYPFMPEWRFRGRTDLNWFPTLQGKAIPGGPVRRDVYDALKAELLQRLDAALPLDGFYLDLHGAMNVQGMDDAEADLARAIRTRVGPSCLIAASMDLHGNVTPELAALVDAFAAYRTAPHVDVYETREKAVAMLVDCLDRGIRPCRAWARIPVILPGERTSTFVEPGRSVYAALAESDAAPGVLDASLWVGYVWADEPRSSATAVVTATDPIVARNEAERIARRYWDARHDFNFIAPAGIADWCIEQCVQTHGQAIFISDSGDNPTAGGVGDIPFFVGRLLKREEFATGRLSAIYASIPDPAAVALCFKAGIGGRVAASIGGKLDTVHGRPLKVEGEVFALFKADATGGDMAALKCGGVHVILTERRKPFHFVSEMQKLGLDPAQHKLTVVKIGYLEPDLARAASKAFLALTPGAVNQDIPNLTYRRVQRPVFPLDPDLRMDEFDVRVFGSGNAKLE